MELWQEQIKASGYPLTLAELAPGNKFQMLNYQSTFIVLELEKPLRCDGYHLPIVDLMSGRLLFMAKVKPVRKVLL